MKFLWCLDSLEVVYIILFYFVNDGELCFFGGEIVVVWILRIIVLIKDVFKIVKIFKWDVVLEKKKVK